MTSHSEPPAREPDLAAREVALGHRLPPLLRARLLRANGGRLGEWSLHPVLDTADRKARKRTAEDIVHLTGVARRDPRFPAEAVSIAHEYSMTDQLVLLPEPAGDGVRRRAGRRPPGPAPTRPGCETGGRRGHRPDRGKSARPRPQPLFHPGRYGGTAVVEPACSDAE